MQVQTVIERELRVQARRRGTYWLRVLAGGATSMVLAFFLLIEKPVPITGPSGRGPWLFAVLHTTVSLVLAVVCPLMSADTLARERREGTLGLLLLTPLRPGSIVLGKIAAHLLRALALWLAVAPVLAVPIMMGGLGVVDFGFALSLEAGVVLGGLAAGLLASSFAERWESAMGLAVLFAVLIGEGLAIVSFLGFLPFFLTHEGGRSMGFFVFLATLMPWVVGSGLIENGFSGMLMRSAGWIRNGVLTGLALAVPVSAVIFGLSVWVASLRLQRFGQIRERSAREESRWRFWWKPRANTWRRLKRFRLQRNPVIWLQTRRPANRLWRWVWTGVVLLVWGGMLLTGINYNDGLPWAFGTPIVLAAALAFAASATFQREFETGALELLLVTPLRPAAILRGLMDGLWGSCLPALTLSSGLAAFWITIEDRNVIAHLPLLMVSWSSFVNGPLVAVRFGVRRVNPLTGWFWTLGLVGALPLVFGLMMALVSAPRGDYDTTFGIRYTTGFVALQCVIGFFCGWTTVIELATRQFQLRPLQRRPD